MTEAELYKKLFLKELAELMEKHNTVIATDGPGNEGVQFIFQNYFRDRARFEVVNTHRCHSTAYEIRRISEKIN